MMYKSFLKAKRQCDKWGDYKMNIAAFDAQEPMYYEFTACPAAEFAKKHGLLEIMPALCNPDFEAMELIHAKLVRKTTCANGKNVTTQSAEIGMSIRKNIPSIGIRTDR